jgi:hypothetical protein
MTLSVVFIFSVVALHGMFQHLPDPSLEHSMLTNCSHRKGHASILSIESWLRPSFFFEAPFDALSWSTLCSSGTFHNSFPLLHYSYPLPSIFVFGKRGIEESGKTLDSDLLAQRPTDDVGKGMCIELHLARCIVVLNGIRRFECIDNHNFAGWTQMPHG